jgi:hypothetical protein
MAAFAKFTTVSDDNPLPVVVVATTGSFDIFAPVTATNPYPVVALADSTTFSPYRPVTRTNTLPVMVYPASGTFDRYAPVSETNLFPVQLITDPGTFNPFAPVSITNPLPIFEPSLLANLATRYDVSDLTSLVHDGSNRVGLYYDKSGNSAENCLVLNGASGNYASTPDSAALSITGDIDLRAKLAATDWTPASDGYVISKISGSANGASYGLVIRPSGILRYIFSTDGTSVTVKDSTVATGVSDFGTKWIRVTHDVDNGAAGYDVKFYTSDDGVSWSQLGATVTTAGTVSIYDSATQIEIGANSTGSGNFVAGRFMRAQIRNGIDGTIVFDADFTQVAKLSGSFTESSANAATVTINASGDTGARICGARDLYQATAGKKGVITTSASGNYVTFDNVNDFAKSAPYSASQPRTRITVFSAITWSANDVLWDGNSAGSAKVYQVTGTPRLTVNAGSDGPSLTTFTRGQVAVAIEVIDGASSSLARNLDEPATGDAGAGNPGGAVIGTDGAGANPSSLVFRERIEYAAALDRDMILRIAGYLMNKWGVAA